MSEATSITGYRKLSEEEIAFMNAVKQHAEETRVLLSNLHVFNNERFVSSALRPVLTADAAAQLAESNRWAALAKTQLQQGFMALNRAVALPTTF